ncbi:MAG: DUF3179 domain-containing (seleno)protein [Actinomycetota bacterium]
MADEVRRWFLVFGLVVAACGDDSPTAETDGNEPPPIEAVPTERSDPPAPASIPPDVDTSTFSVDPSEILFDTFDGGSVPLSESDEQLRSRLLDRIPPIDDPIYTDAADGGAWLEDDDVVLGYVAGGIAYAYPTKILNFHEIVNTEIDDLPVLVSYCPLCRSGIVYDRRLPDGQLLTFSNTSALVEADMVMVDRETGSYWWQVLGEGIVGPLTGTALTPLASQMATWGDWLERHPETVVLSRDTGFERRYEVDRFSTYAERVAVGDVPFHPDEIDLDDRLLPSEPVVIVDLTALGGDGVVAYPTELFDGPVEDRVGGIELLITPHELGATVTAPDGDPLPSRSSFWFAAVGAFPEIEVRTGTPTS